MTSLSYMVRLPITHDCGQVPKVTGPQVRSQESVRDSQLKHPTHSRVQFGTVPGENHLASRTRLNESNAKSYAIRRKGRSAFRSQMKSPQRSHNKNATHTEMSPHRSFCVHTPLVRCPHPALAIDRKFPQCICARSVSRE